MFQRKLKEKEEKKIAIEKWNNILPILLFLVVLVNYIPVFKLNFNVKQSFAADVVALVTAFGIECFILALFYLKRIKLSKPVIINFIAILIVTIISSVIQIINYKNNSYEIMDFANIACKFVNIILLFESLFPVIPYNGVFNAANSNSFSVVPTSNSFVVPSSF